LFISAYSPDISKIEAAISKKRTGRGQSNDEMKFKLREIDKRMQKVGGRLHCSLLDLDHDHEFSENDEEDDNFSSSMNED
jgi:hypothetical protein